MKAPRIETSITSRQTRLRALLSGRKLDYLLITHMPNVAYLTAFRGSAGMVLLGAQESILFVDPRYTLQAGEQARGVEVREAKQRLLDVVGAWLQKHRARELGVDDANMTFAAWKGLQEAVGGRCRLRPTGGLVEDLRMVKDGLELGLIRQAAHLTSEVFEEVRGLAKPGVCEADLAAEIEYRLKRKGAEGVAFESIVASGPRSALPHARVSPKLLKKNEFVIFDLGAIISGYAADMTRTIYLGKPDTRARCVYKAVLESQKKGVLASRPGAEAGTVDAAVRRVLARHRLSEYFTHSTGHGVGLEIHERPRIARGEAQPLRSGFVVTVEPGVYLEGFGGVRVEDTIAIGDHGPEVLTSSPKEDWIIA
jgi:Xaa-Pro aminopeptidase